jgi:hypothetical protein
VIGLPDVIRFIGFTSVEQIKGRAIGFAAIMSQGDQSRVEVFDDPRLLLDSRGVDVPMAYNSTFVMFSSLKPLFFKSFKNDLCFLDNVGA